MTLVRLAVLFFLVGSLISCQEKAEVDDSDPIELVDVGADQTAADKFINKLITTVLEQDHKTLASLFSTHAYVDLVLEGVDFPKAMRAEFMKGVNKSLRQKKGGRGWFLFAYNRASYVGIREFEGTKYPVVRFDLPDGGSDFIFFQLMKGPYGTPRILDTFALSAGEWCSQVTRRMILPALAAEMQSPLMKLVNSKEDKLAMEHFNKTQKILNSYANGDFAAVRKTYESLPTELQEQRQLFVTYLMTVTDDDQALVKAGDRFAKVFGDDPSVAFMMIDVDFSAGRLDKVLERITQVEELIGEDPVLALLRANIHLQLNQEGAAQSIIQKVHQLDPTIEETYWTAIQLAAQTSNYDEALLWMNRYQTEFDYKLTKEDFNPESLALLLQSKEIDAWFSSSPSE